MAFSLLLPPFLCLLLFHFHFHANCLPSFLPNTSYSTLLCKPDQSHALLLFKNSISIRTRVDTYSDQYPKTNTWREGTDCCLWDGVSCHHQTGYVIGLNLSHSMLYGSIHSDSPLFFLSHLQKLDLSYNDFNGSQISPWFGYFFNLIYLNLNSSNFVGQVPSEIAQLSNLVSLDLSGNLGLTVETNTFNKLAQNLSKLRELIFTYVDMSLVAPPSLMNLSSSLSTLKLRHCRLGQKFLEYLPLSDRLVSLDLSDNDLILHSNAFVKIVQNLSNLRDLDLSSGDLSLVESSSFLNLPSSLSSLQLWYCGLKGKFPDIFHLSKLVTLDMSGNRNLTMDAILFNKLVLSLPNLTEVHLDGLNLSSVEPSNLLNLSSSLSSLRLGDCGLRGEFPGNLIQRPNLQTLYLSSNEDLNVSLPMSNCSSSLQELDLSFTKIQILLQPDFFNNLKSLKRLGLSGCKFVGSDLDLFGNLTELNYLLISYNNFSGQIPLSFQNLKKLSYLNFTNSNFSGQIPNYFANFTQLQFLSLSNNRLTGPIPSLLASNLFFLDLSNNRLTGPIPSLLPSNLFHLRLSNNRLTGPIPSLLASNLFFLGLSNNLLNGTIPYSLVTLPGLSSLLLSNNQLHGPIPSLQNNSLSYLDLSNNQLHGPIPSLQNNSLIYLDLSNNQLHGPIPSLQNNSLSYLLLSNNQLHGPIPSLQNNSLSYLDLSNNQLHGPIPSFQNNSLSYLALSNNQLHGPIPSFQSNSLSYIDLGNNMLHGAIPNSIFNIVKLRVLILSSNNKLIGEVSSSFCNLHYLQILDLSNNSLSGFIPSCLGNLSNSLSVLHFGINNFQGIIFDTFSESCQLRYLNFKGNQLRGQIPPSVTNCKNLEFVDISNNKIDDEFPYFLGILSNLQVLVMHSNKFHGSVKTFNVTCPFPALRIFDLSNNSFNGPLPAEYFDHFGRMMDSERVLSYMSSKNYTYAYSVSLTVKGLEITLLKIQNILTTIDLSQNKFTGSIPHSIGKLKALIHLNLSHNSLIGNISPLLSNLSNLESLDLSSNLLSGRIPMKLAELTFLAIFRVAHNRLEGPIPQGKQFGTFDNSSYEGNSGLCGFPLETCNNVKPQSPSKQEDSDNDNGFGWKAVVTGYGCGTVFGLAMGYLVFTTKKPTWFVRMVEGNRRSKGFEKKKFKSHGRRN